MYAVLCKDVVVLVSEGQFCPLIASQFALCWLVVHYEA